MVFKTKHIPWNKSKKGIHLSPKTEFKKGHKWTEEIENKRRKSISQSLLGKIIPKNIREKISKTLKRKNKTSEIDSSKHLKNYYKNNDVWNKGTHIQTNSGKTHFKKGHKQSKELLEKRGKALSMRYKKGELISSMLGKQQSEETKKKKSDWMIKNNPFRGKKHSEKTKNIIRTKLLKRIIKLGGPKFGKNETQILDNLEQELGYKILRQHIIDGYAIDGYIKELNLAIEIDEKYHIKQKDKDLLRQNYIEKKLNCKFVRLKDYV